MKITDKVSDERLREMLAQSDISSRAIHSSRESEIASVCNELLSARTTIALMAASLKQQDERIADLEALVKP